MRTATIECNGKTLTVFKSDLDAFVRCHELDPTGVSQPFPFHVERDGHWSDAAEYLVPDDIDLRANPAK